MSYNSLITETKDRVLTIRLHEPDKRNALTTELRQELLAVLTKAEQNENIRAIVLTGEGKGFSAGGDLNAIKDLEPLEGRKRLQSSHPLIHKMLEIEKPIIAAVNGAAAGAGFSIVLLCDYVLAAEEAFFIQSFVHVGLVPDFAAIHFLPTLIGVQRAKELMFLGDRVTAEDAHRLGIVNKVVSGEDLMDEAGKIANRLANNAPLSIAFTKKMMNNHINQNLNVLLEMEAQAQDLCFQSEDFKEGVKAFFEKRKPNFTGK